MNPLSRSNDCPIEDDHNVEIVSVMKGRRAINRYDDDPETLNWDKHGLGRIHRTREVYNRPLRTSDNHPGGHSNYPDEP